MTPDYEALFGDFFNEAADAAGSIALKYFRKEIAVDSKQDKTPVTEADREIEKMLRDMISKKFPDHGVIGEEFGKVNERAEFVWVLDPIDGTRAFMTGKPLFGTLIGLMHQGRPVAGLIEQAFTKERWFGVDRRFARHNGKPVHAAKPRMLEEARFYTGAPYMFYGDTFENYLELCRTVRWPQFGCDCYAYGLMAMGWADLVIERKLKLHDVAAIAPIVSGAGGFISDWNLKPVGFDFDGNIVAASSRELAESAVGILKRPVLN